MERVREAEESQEMTDGKSNPLPEIKVYKWRWVVLGLFFLNNMSMNYVWIMAAPVANLITCYYRTSDIMVNLLSTSYMIMYTLMVLPVSWAMDRYGLRVCAVLASAACALGTSIKVFGSGKCQRITAENRLTLPPLAIMYCSNPFHVKYNDVKYCRCIHQVERYRFVLSR